ncbi:hypothetical protein PAESOLCIP111_06713 [Paenibacillus solanacearum]|uniref:Bacterial HORMA domain-containing protein n=2 Tax=Paenibacillus solanacearum TaxID=2048548 RepID=A0A916K8E6_9BACL|nr:hypothetical protein PAESOLCIP111_06713 [Paenibacillus solanacearum]
MSYSSSTTRTSTATWSCVRYLNDKIASDLDYLRTFYPNLYSETDIEHWKHDFYNWIFEGYARSIKLQFSRNGTCICEIEWEVRDDGSISSDDNVGKLRIKGIDGTTPFIRIETTEKWAALTQEQRNEFYREMKRSWGPVGATVYADGLIRVYDKQYSGADLLINQKL